MTQETRFLQETGFLPPPQKTKTVNYSAIAMLRRNAIAHFSSPEKYHPLRLIIPKSKREKISDVGQKLPLDKIA